MANKNLSKDFTVNYESHLSPNGSRSIVVSVDLRGNETLGEIIKLSEGISACVEEYLLTSLSVNDS